MACGAAPEATLAAAVLQIYAYVTVTTVLRSVEVKSQGKPGIAPLRANPSQACLIRSYAPPVGYEIGACRIPSNNTILNTDRFRGQGSLTCVYTEPAVVSKNE
jgi:hypothetical protein